MRAKTPPLLIALLLALCASTARAQTAQDYSVSVPVTDQGETSRDQALREALGAVASKVSGPQAAAKDSPVVLRAASLVQQYSYSSDDKGALFLTASFDPAAVDAALKAQGLPVWGIVSGNVEDVALNITGVTTPRAYAHVLAYVRAQPGVKSVNVAEIDGGTLHLRLHAEGGAARLAGAFSVGSVLKQQNSADAREFSFALQNP
jgi:hypothetical protein